jgi:uncharacterized protein (TIGR02145 family)
MHDGKQWMTQNLNIHMQGAYCYDMQGSIVRSTDVYIPGNRQKKGCEMLGKEWRLPTNEEWQQMVKHYGGIRIELKQDGKEAYRRLVQGGDAQFNIILGGTRDPSGDYRRLKAHGFYWTATEQDSANAWFYNLGKGGQYVNRHMDGEKSGAISVRCIR